MNRLLPLLLCWASGCAAYAPATPEQLRELGLEASPAAAGVVRCRIHLGVVSAWLSGEFDGVVMARPGASPIVRAQFFGDLGPKVFDLLASPERIAGYFPQTLQGVDCRLPDQAAIHPLLFVGATLLEEFCPLREDRVSGIRGDGKGTWIRLRPVVPGMESEAYLAEAGRWARRRFGWIYGLSWTETRISNEERLIEASGLTIRVRMLAQEAVAQPPPTAFELRVPADVKLVEGSRP